MKYWQVILIKHLEWAIISRQPSYFIRVVKALVRRNKYSYWLGQEIFRLRSANLKEGEKKYTKNMPSLTDYLHTPRKTGFLNYRMEI